MRRYIRPIILFVFITAVYPDVSFSTPDKGFLPDIKLKGVLQQSQSKRLKTKIRSQKDHIEKLNEIISQLYTTVSSQDSVLGFQDSTKIILDRLSLSDYEPIRLTPSDTTIKQMEKIVEKHNSIMRKQNSTISVLNNIIKKQYGFLNAPIAQKPEKKQIKKHEPEKEKIKKPVPVKQTELSVVIAEISGKKIVEEEESSKKTVKTDGENLPKIKKDTRTGDKPVKKEEPVPVKKEVSKPEKKEKKEIPDEITVKNQESQEISHPQKKTEEPENKTEIVPIEKAPVRTETIKEENPPEKKRKLEETKNEENPATNENTRTVTIITPPRKPVNRESSKTGVDGKILFPESGQEYKTLESIPFVAHAFDYSQRYIPEDSLIWESDKDGIIGRGLSIKKDLSANFHRIIFRAKNNGYSISDTTYINVKNRYINELPEIIQNSVPEFPEEVVNTGIQGIITLYLLIDEEGTVEDARVIKNTTNNKKCEEIALDAARKIKFNPAKEFGKPRKYTMFKEYGVGSLFTNPDLSVGTKITEELRKEMAEKNLEAQKRESLINPAPISKVFPIIKRKDLRIETKGNIDLCVSLSKEGRISRLLIYKMTFKDRQYIEASIMAAIKSKYRPALQKGLPIETKFIIPYSYGYNNKDVDIGEEIWEYDIKDNIVFADTTEYQEPEFRLKEVKDAIEKKDIKEFTLYFKITEKGKVKNITPIDEEKVDQIEGLKKDAEKSIKKSKYSPAFINDEKTESYIIMYYDLEKYLKEAGVN